MKTLVFFLFKKRSTFFKLDSVKFHNYFFSNPIKPRDCKFDNNVTVLKPADYDVFNFKEKKMKFKCFVKNFELL